MKYLVISLAISLLALTSAYADGTSTPAHVFPAIEATDLNGKNLHLPADFASANTLCLIAFDRQQQGDIQTWLDGASSIVGPAGISIYEIPTIARLPSFVRNFINSGMRRGIPDRSDRAHTITLYIDKAPFRQSLGLGTERTIYAVLIDRKGTVIWSSSGDYTSASGESLRQTVSKLASEQNDSEASN